MRILLIIASMAGLVLTIVPSVMVFVQEMSLDNNKQLMLLGMVLWFGTSPFWMKEQEL